jgi:glycosyltransferase involved in cell wall biosynthesis
MNKDSKIKNASLVTALRMAPTEVFSNPDGPEFIDQASVIGENSGVLGHVFGRNDSNGNRNALLHDDKNPGEIMQTHDAPFADLLHGTPAIPGLAFSQENNFISNDDGYRPKIIAGLAAYNEEEYIGSMVLGTRPFVDQVIVVDDGSSDRTAKFAGLAGAKVIRHKSNQGKGKAIQTLLKEAKKMDVEMVVLLDADCQQNPEEIPQLIKPIINGEADLVNGSRFLEKKSKIPVYRRFGQHFLTLLTNVCSGTKVTDSQSGFRALSRKAINSLKINENGMGVESEMIQCAKELNLRIKEVPMSCRYDVDGSTFNPVSHGFRVIGTILDLLQRKHPLIYFGLPGLILLSIGAFLSLSTFYAYNILGQFWLGKAMIAMVLLLVGIFALFTGLILNSVSITMKELSKSDRP